MSATFSIQRLQWDAWNRDHIAKHGVTIEEVSEVVAGKWFARETYKGRTLLIGFTDSRRMLAVVVGPVPNEINVYYVFSARPASRKERRDYFLQEGGGVP
jgi:uncharacterized DUF497 family protein